MLTLKHLARELDMDPYTVRQRLRAANLSPLVNGRWKWPDTQDPQYQAALKAAQSPHPKQPKSSPPDTPPSPPAQKKARSRSAVKPTNPPTSGTSRPRRPRSS